MNVYLSNRFTLADLTKTDAPLVVPNMFDSPEHEDNLRRGALVLETLIDNIGPFDVISGYRSKAVQAWLAEENDTAAAASFHSIGLGFDIKPTSMTAEAYFAKILGNKAIRNSLGEIALKSTVLHISIAVPGKTNVPMIVRNGVYERITEAEQESILAKYGVTVGLGAGFLALLGAGALGLMYFLKRRAEKRPE